MAGGYSRGGRAIMNMAMSIVQRFAGSALSVRQSSAGKSIQVLLKPLIRLAATRQSPAVAASVLKAIAHSSS
jgi:hypothetical protein